MIQVGEFEKVSYKQFEQAMKSINGDYPEYWIKQIYDNIKLPQRATTGSAGYDFFAPHGITLAPNETIKVATGIRVNIVKGWFLAIVPRSGLGSKFRMQLNNTIGIIDSDYYYSDNEGHIFAMITNDTNENKTINIEDGQGIMQGIFLPFGITRTDVATNIRNGGFGSTTS